MQHCSLMSHYHLQKQHTARLVRDGHRYKSLLLNSLHCFCHCLIPTHYHRYLFTVIQFTPVTLQAFHPLSFLCYIPTFDHIMVIVFHLPISTFSTDPIFSSHSNVNSAVPPLNLAIFFLCLLQSTHMCATRCSTFHFHYLSPRLHMCNFYIVCCCFLLCYTCYPLSCLLNGEGKRSRPNDVVTLPVH